MDEEIKPKPCPFCGGEPTLCDDIITEDGLVFYVVCNCEALSRMMKTEKEAITVWNRRRVQKMGE